uniref:BUD13 homolog n=1 Tax=Caenorhabditis tropicalis TaxID=1561998 RepID=A0A1I7U694_9PELO
MTSKADYLKKYLSNDQEKKKKKKKKVEGKGLRLIEEDAFLSVDAAKSKDIGSDEEREEIEVLRQSAKKAKVVHGFKQTFAEIDIKKEIKEEPMSRENSPPRGTRHSPPRASRRRHDSDNSPVRASRRHDSDEDNSPPRRPRQRNDSDNSPPRASQRKRRDSDNSPPRRPRQRNDSDNSPPRASQRKRRDSDNSPPRRRRRDSDNSPPRRGGRGRKDDDLSPPRKSRRVDEPKVIKKEEPDSDSGEGKKTLEGKRSGLQSAKDLREESDRLREKNAKLVESFQKSIITTGFR